ncbi:MAG: hypothetical protein ACRDLM_03680 [Gaiellaceae bacterium]
MERRGFLLVVIALALLAGSASTAKARPRALTRTITTKFVVSFSGTNTTSWTLGQGTGFDCSYGSSATWPVAGGSGNQLISIKSAGRAKKRTLTLVFYYAGRRLDDMEVKLPIAGSAYGGNSFQVDQSETRSGSITAPGSSQCLTDGSGHDFSLGGPNSLCGSWNQTGVQGMAFDVEYDRNDNFVMKKGGLEFGIGSGALGGTGKDPYYNGNQPDCPIAGDNWLPFYLPQLPAGSDARWDDFLLFSHSSPDNLFDSRPAYAPFSLKGLISCKVPKLSTKYSGHDSFAGPFDWTGIDSPPAGWARWNATASLHWSMSLKRTSCKKSST